MTLQAPPIAPETDLPSGLMMVDEFLPFAADMEAQGRRFELIDGIPTEKPVTSKIHGKTTVRLSFFVQGYFFRMEAEMPDAWAGGEVASRVPHSKHNVRQPDLSIFLNETVEDAEATKLPDIAVEVKLRSNSYRKLRERAYFYLEHGTKAVWLIYPARRQVEVITADDEIVLMENDLLTAEDILPGFSVRVGDILPRPVAKP